MSRKFSFSVTKRRMTKAPQPLKGLSKTQIEPRWSTNFQSSTHSGIEGPRMRPWKLIMMDDGRRQTEDGQRSKCRSKDASLWWTAWHPNDWNVTVAMYAIVKMQHGEYVYATNKSQNQMNGDAREKRARERKDPKIESRSEGNESQAEEGQERVSRV